MDIERKRSAIINFVYYAILLVLFYLLLKYAFWLFFPVVFSFTVALLLQPPVNAITKRTPVKRGLASVICLLLLVFIIVGLIVVIGASAVNYFKGFSEHLRSLIGNTSQLVENFKTWSVATAEKLPEFLSKRVLSTLQDFFSKIDTSTNQATAESTVNAVANSSKGFNFDFASLSKWITTPVTSVLMTAKQIPSILLNVLITIIMTCFLTADFNKVTAFLKAQLSEKHQKDFARAKVLLKTTFLKIVRAYALIILVTFVEVLIGLTVLKLIGVYNSSYIVIVAAVTAFVDILPALGTGTVMFPWAIYSFITGNTGFAVGLIVLYVIMAIIRQIIEPKLVAGQLGLPPFLTIIGMFVGLKLFGFIGMFLIPVLIIMIKLLNDEGILHLWKTPEKAEDESSETPAPKKKLFSKKAAAGQGNPPVENEPQPQETDSEDKTE